MTVRGRKPRPTAVKEVLGNPGRRPLPTNEPMPVAEKCRPPLKMTGRPAALWKRFVRPAWWLTDSDGAKAWLWCQMQAEVEADVKAMTAARIGQLRALGSELGFDPASRARMGSLPSEAGGDPAAQFF